MRRIWLSTLILARSLGVYPFLGIALWCLVTKIQEPSLLVRQGLYLHLESTRSALCLLLCLVGLMPRMSQAPDVQLDLLRRSPRPCVQVCLNWLGLVIYGSTLLLWGLICGYTTDRISPSTPDLGAWLPTAWDCLRLLCTTASLSPALSVLPGRPATLLLLWCLSCTGVLTVLGFSTHTNPAPGQFQAASFALQTVCCILGGLLVSFGVILARLRN